MGWHGSKQRAVSVIGGQLPSTGSGCGVGLIMVGLVSGVGCMINRMRSYVRCAFR